MKCGLWSLPRKKITVCTVTPAPTLFQYHYRDGANFAALLLLQSTILVYDYKW